MMFPITRSFGGFLGLRGLLWRGGKTFLSTSTNNVQKTIQSIWLENEAAKRIPSSEHYSFMPSAHRIIRKMERSHGSNAIEPISDLLLDARFDGPAYRMLIGTLTRLLPTRQAIFERSLDEQFPAWRDYLKQTSPQSPYPMQFKFAQTHALQTKLDLSDKTIQCFEKGLRSKYADVAIQTLKSCERLGHERLNDSCFDLIRCNDEAVRQRAILTCARLSKTDRKMKEYFRNFLYSAELIEDKVLAFEAFMDVFQDPESQKMILGMMEDPKLRPLFLEFPFLNSLLDLAREDINGGLEKCLSQLDFSKAPNDFLRRVARAEFLNRQIQLQARTILNRQPLVTSRFGLLAHRDGKLKIGFRVGHAGIFVSESDLIDVNPDRDPHAVQQVSFAHWKDGYECWGVREDDDHPWMSLQKAVERARKIASWRTEYDGTHNNQKGDWFKGVFCGPRYWEIDCVGFVENCYESAGGDPIPHEGMYITPTQQRDHMRKVFDC